MPDPNMYDRIANGRGFIAALDQSGGSTPKALAGYGYRGDEWSSEEEMFDLSTRCARGSSARPASAAAR